MTDFIATWSSHNNWRQIHDDGREQVDDVILPPLKVLEKHALEIVKGYLIADRIGGWEKIWEPEDEPFYKVIDRDPGMLKITTSFPKRHSIYNDGRPAKLVDDLRYVQWHASWRIAGDADSYGFTSGHSSPSLALAQMIALCEEDERRIRSEMLELTGGLS